MELPTDKQLDEALAEIQGLLNQLEALIKRQSGDATGESGKPSKKDSIARTAIEKAKESLEDRQAIRKPQLEISAVLKARLEQTIVNKANDNVIGEARGQYRAAVKQIDDADKATLSRLDAARKHADKAIKARTGSYTRLAQEAANLQLRQAEEATARAARQAQEATARRAQETTARQAQKVVARQVEETTACRAQEDVDLRAHRAQETVNGQNQEAATRAPDSQIDDDMDDPFQLYSASPRLQPVRRSPTPIPLTSAVDHEEVQPPQLAGPGADVEDKRRVSAAAS